MTALMDNIQNIDVKKLLKKPLWQMTGEEFLALSNAAATKAEDTQTSSGTPQTSSPHEYSEKSYIRGLYGLCKVFGIARSTAQHYKNTFLKPAVIQQGQAIWFDRNLTLQLFEEHFNKSK